MFKRNNVRITHSRGFQASPGVNRGIFRVSFGSILYRVVRLRNAYPNGVVFKQGASISVERRGRAKKMWCDPSHHFPPENFQIVNTD